eukprot:scaffold1353_cov161-Amphora_coffeaeformis.AAC.26
MKISAATLLAFAVPAALGFTTSSTTIRSPSSSLWAKPKVFIDGEAGTTGIQVYERLNARDDLEVISAPFELRKDEATRKKLINEADAVILCKYTYYARFFCER